MTPTKSGDAVSRPAGPGAMAGGGARPARTTACAFARWTSGALLVMAALGAAVPARAQAVTEVEVTRVKPTKDKHPTLRFLKENRNFIRARLDLLRQTPRSERGDGGALDPRFLAYQRMLTTIRAAEDSTRSAADRRGRDDLLAHAGALDQLESELDAMERLLGGQRQRLGALQEDFAARQQTALMVLLRGWPGEAALATVTLRDEDGDEQVVALSSAQRTALEHGGVIELEHRFIEPREQTIEVLLNGAAWPHGERGFVTITPARDRLMMLELDASAIGSSGVTGIRATTWLHDPTLERRGG